MHRRAFARHLLLTGLAAPAVVAGSAIPAAGGHDDGRIGPPPFGHVTLRLPLGRVTVRHFMVLTDDAVYGIDLRQEVPQMPAERIDLGAVPLIGRILTPTLERQFAGATPVGPLHLVGNALFLLPAAPWPAHRIQVQITHRKLVYRPAVSLRRMEASGIPARARIEGTTPIGTALLHDEALLGVIPPSRPGRFLVDTPASV